VGSDVESSDRRVDEDAIRELLDRQAMAWAAGDPDADAGVFTPDADYVTFLGSHYKGREAIAASYVSLFKKFLKGSRLDTEITQLRFLTPDVALIHAKRRCGEGGTATRCSRAPGANFATRARPTPRRER
jgi:uncharacterized protein (TIGR02246 family)